MGTYFLLVILIVIASFLMVGIVLIQESKGGGLASNFASYNQIGGVRKTTDFIEKATWGLAAFMVVASIAFMVVASIVCAYVAPKNDNASNALDQAVEAPMTSPANSNGLVSSPVQEEQPAAPAEAAAPAENQ